MENAREIIVIGAGLGGLAAAAELRGRGHDVLVIDKGRGVGGRMATRRVGNLRMDHGAQFFTLRDSRIEALLAPLMTGGEVFQWSRGFPEWRNGAIHPRPEGHPRFACRSGMSALAKFLAKDLDLALGEAVTSVKRERDLWVLELAGGTRFQARTLLMNTPPAQLLPLVEAFLDEHSRRTLATLEMDPTWAVFGEVDRDPELGGVALEFHQHPIFRFIARDHTRRMPGQPPSLVAHCNERWSREHLDSTPAEVAEAVSSELLRLLGVRFIESPQVHRWKFATPAGSLGADCLWSPAQRLGACGDWCLGGRVEGAILSGRALAEKI
jgi:renalase